MNPLEAACEVINLETNGKPEMDLLKAKARALMGGYHKRWAGQQYVTLAVEEVVTSSLFNPATQARSRTFDLGGKIDVRAELDGEIVIVDHKTTSEDIADPNATYWRQLIIESQLSHYLLMEWLNGSKPAKAMWDVIRKPSISPRQLTKAEQKEIAFDKTWCGFELDNEEIQDALAIQRETMRLYELRLLHDCMIERPDRYFQRRTIPRLDSEIFEYAGEIWDHSQDIILARRNGRHPRNSGACMQYGSPCQFLGVCSGYDEIESEKWQRSQWVHPELPRVGDSDGKDLLTNSRIRTWQTCRRKHKFQYIDGIERTEDRESLIFGDLMHKALAAWWEQFKQGEQYGYSSSDSATGVEVA